MKSIVRRDTGEDWKEYLRRLMTKQGLIEPDAQSTAEELRRFDKKRKDKRVSNDEWVSKTDPDSRITNMKDRRTHLAYKAENVIDLETELVLAAEIYPANRADTDTLIESVSEAPLNLSEAGLDVEIEEAVADKGYHAIETLKLADDVGVRTYIPEPQYANGRTWKDKLANAQRVVTNNSRRTRTAKSKRLQRKRRAFIRSHLRDARRVADVVLRLRQGSKAVLDVGDGPQLGPAHARVVRHGHRAELAR